MTTPSMFVQVFNCPICEANTVAMADGHQPTGGGWTRAVVWCEAGHITHKWRDAIGDEGGWTLIDAPGIAPGV